jgi:hypothetical protein
LGSLKKLELELPYGPAVYLKERKSSYNRDACTPMFIATLLTIASPSVGEWIKKMWKLYVLPHMWTLGQGQTQQWDWTLIT